MNLLKNDIDITYNEFNYIKDQPGNYRETLREHDDAIDELGWKPKDPPLIEGFKSSTLFFELIRRVYI